MAMNDEEREIAVLKLQDALIKRLGHEHGKQCMAIMQSSLLAFATMLNTAAYYPAPANEEQIDAAIMACINLAMDYIGSKPKPRMYRKLRGSNDG